MTDTDDLTEDDDPHVTPKGQKYTDEYGAPLVVRGKGPSSRAFHRPHDDSTEDDPVPACKEQNNAMMNPSHWSLIRFESVTGFRKPCGYPQCYGDATEDGTMQARRNQKGTSPARKIRDLHRQAPGGKMDPDDIKL